MVARLMFLEDELQIYFLRLSRNRCVGTLISPIHVLTLASCFLLPGVKILVDSFLKSSCGYRLLSLFRIDHSNHYNRSGDPTEVTYFIPVT